MLIGTSAVVCCLGEMKTSHAFKLYMELPAPNPACPFLSGEVFCLPSRRYPGLWASVECILVLQALPPIIQTVPEFLPLSPSNVKEINPEELTERSLALPMKAQVQWPQSFGTMPRT